MVSKQEPKFLPQETTKEKIKTKYIRRRVKKKEKSRKCEFWKVEI